MLCNEKKKLLDPSIGDPILGGIGGLNLGFAFSVQLEQLDRQVLIVVFKGRRAWRLASAPTKWLSLKGDNIGELGKIQKIAAK